MGPDDDDEALRRECEKIGAMEVLQRIFRLYPELAQVNGHTHSEGILAQARQFGLAAAKAQRRTYSEATKQEALKRLAEGEGVTAVRKNMGIASSSQLYYWAKKAGVSLGRVKRLALPPAPTTTTTISKKKRSSPHKKKKPQLGETPTQKSLRLAVTTLKGMPDDADVHYTDVAKKQKFTVKNAYWYFLQRLKARHVERTGKGTFRKTPEGKKWQDEHA